MQFGKEFLEGCITQNTGIPVFFADGNTSDTIHPNTTIVPQSTSGFQNVYNGTYQTATNQNKVTIQRIITSELCGQVTQVW